MNSKLSAALDTLIPFIVLGFAIALILGLIFMLSYVLIWGFIIGGVLWIAALIKQILFPAAAVKTEEGRIIEHDDKK